LKKYNLMYDSLINSKKEIDNPFFNECLSRIQNTLIRILNSKKINKKNHILLNAISYILLNGKKIRGLLDYATATSIGIPIEHCDISACAIEMIHAYSLIHDDLPSMDNDMKRRGRDSCHIAFDESTAILAGDSLHSLAFEILSDSNPGISDHKKIQIIHTLSKAIGIKGMVLGQYLDINNFVSLKYKNKKKLDIIYNFKTGNLIKASVKIGYLKKNKLDKKYKKAFDKFSYHIALAFQIQDDIIDSLKDNQNISKNTYPKILGIKKSIFYIKNHFNCALKNLNLIPNNHKLKTLTKYIILSDFLE